MLETSNDIYRKFSFVEPHNNPVQAVLTELEHSRIGRRVKNWLAENKTEIIVNNTYKGGTYSPSANQIEFYAKHPDFYVLTQIVHEARHAWQFSQFEEDFVNFMTLNPAGFIAFGRMVEADAYSFENMFAFYHLTERGFDTSDLFNNDKNPAELTGPIGQALKHSLTDPSQSALARRQLFDAYFQYQDHSNASEDDKGFAEMGCDFLEGVGNAYDNIDLDQVDFVPEMSAETLAKIGDVVGFGGPTINMFTTNYGDAYKPYDRPYCDGLSKAIINQLKKSNFKSAKSDRALQFSDAAFRPMLAGSPIQVDPRCMPIPPQPTAATAHL